MASRSGARIVALHLCVEHRQPMKNVDTAKLIAGVGIEGDGHAVSDGVRKARQVLLMDQETLDALDLSPGEVRENVTTSGLDLSSLEAGQQVSLGRDVVVEITGPCAPCARMDEIRSGLKDELEDRRGKLGFVVDSGIISVGDAVRAAEPVA